MKFEKLECEENIWSGLLWPIDDNKISFAVKKFTPFQKHIIGKQVHGKNVTFVDKLPINQVNCDGFITNINNLALAIKTADCLPILAFDKISNLVGVCHAGWRGLSRGIVTELVNQFIQHRSKSSDIHFIIGPHAQVCCYEIDNSNKLVRSAFDDKYNNCFSKKNSKIFFNLSLAAKIELKRFGINNSTIKIDSRCTICNSINFPSWRREKSNSSILSIIGLLTPKSAN